jgi:hypothetical protein
MPAAPKEMVQDLKSPTGPSTIVLNLAVDLATKRSYVASSQELAGAERTAPAERILANSRAGYASSFPGGKVANELKATLAGHPGTQFQIEGAAVASVARIIVVNGRIYTAAVGGAGISPSDADVTRFFDSFLLLTK